MIEKMCQVIGKSSFAEFPDCSSPKIVIQLSQALHPEDTKTTEDDLKDVTVSNVPVDEICNDHGFTVGTTLMILIEVQSFC